MTLRSLANAAPAKAAEMHAEIPPGGGNEAPARKKRGFLDVLQRPPLPRGISRRRTQAVNADPQVAATRLHVEALLSGAFPDAAAVRRKLERRLLKSSLQGSVGGPGGDLALLQVVANPAGLDAGWFGATVTGGQFPDPITLGPALNDLTGALQRARLAAEQAIPVKCEP